jgi:probable rRNA maturation factor
MKPTVILKRRVRGGNERVFERFTSDACKAAGLRGWITVLITGSREIAVLNGRFRKKNKPTDVLSFPPIAYGDGFAGDIAISADIATRNARNFGHSVSDEIRILILHGVLHLTGYDHEADNGQMANKEQRLRRQLGLPVSLIERNSRGRKAKKMPDSGRRNRAKVPSSRSSV